MSAERLLSDAPTLELIVKAREGDNAAVDAFLERSLPRMRRWAHGRLPRAARSSLDTTDLVQEVGIKVLKSLQRFEPRHGGAMEAFLRRSVINRIRDEVRRVGRRPIPVELPDTLTCDAPSALERAISAQSHEGYRRALAKLRQKDRRLIVACVELQWPTARIAARFGFPSRDAARIAVRRALQRLAAAVKPAGARSL